MRTPTLLAGLVLVAGALTGCGGNDAGTGASDTTTYCDQLKADKTYFSAFSGGDVDASQLGQAISRFHDLADAAPADIAPQWDILDGALSEVERALSEAGISTEDLAGLQSGKIPKGVDMSKLAGLATKVKALDSTQLQDAAKKIQTHAKDTCHVDLSKAAAGG
jgi:hypothetical protein